MTRTMYDGINSDVSAIPASAQIVAGYVDGLYKWSAADWARFPNAIKVRIAVFTSTNDGTVLDCEQGNNTPAGSVDWVLMRRRAGVDPTVYCGKNTWWPQIRASFQARGVPEPHYWVADYSGIRQIPAGAIALQYTDTGSYDLSIVADHWPGIDPPQEAEMTLSTDQEAQLLNDTHNDYLATFYGGTSCGLTPPGHSTNSLINKLDYLVAQAAGYGTPLDAKTLAGTLAAQIQPAITQAIASGIAPEADALATTFEQHIAAALTAATAAK